MRVCNWIRTNLPTTPIQHCRRMLLTRMPALPPHVLTRMPALPPHVLTRMPVSITVGIEGAQHTTPAGSSAAIGKKGGDDGEEVLVKGPSSARLVLSPISRPLKHNQHTHRRCQSPVVPGTLQTSKCFRTQLSRNIISSLYFALHVQLPRTDYNMQVRTMAILQ
jgi:hypothetical protein